MAATLHLLATFYRRGGLTVLTPAEGPPVVRTTVHPDGDVLTITTPALNETLLNQHVAAVNAQLAALATARARVVATLATTLAGGSLLASGLLTDGSPSTWLSWIGGGACLGPVGAGAMAVWRVRRWFRGKGAFGPPRAA